MKIILLKDVENLGKKHDVVEVSDGYAKNFLFRKKLGVLYTETSIKKLDQELEVEESIENEKLMEFNLLKSELESKIYEFYLKSNHGAAFGEITAKQVIDKVNEKKKLINKFMFVDKHSWTLGPNTIKLKLYNNVYANLRINVKEEK